VIGIPSVFSVHALVWYSAVNTVCKFAAVVVAPGVKFATGSNDTVGQWKSPERCPDPCYQIFTHPGSRIQKQQQKRGVKKICCQNFFCNHKFYKIENYFIFEMLKKKIWAGFLRIKELFTQNFFTGILDP
jgi:hypothetical protein